MSHACRSEFVTAVQFFYRKIVKHKRTRLGEAGSFCEKGEG